VCHSQAPEGLLRLSMTQLEVPLTGLRRTIWTRYFLETGYVASLSSAALMSSPVAQFTYRLALPIVW
jgi:hypothetical protein